MSQQQRMRNEQDSAPEFAYNIDQLEDLVSNGKRLPMSSTVLVNEDDFIQLLDEIRASIPLEIREAQRLIKERERLIGEAQDQATRIVNDAKKHARELVDSHTVLQEAKNYGEEILREAEVLRQQQRGEMEVYVLDLLDTLKKATISAMSNMEATADRAIRSLESIEAELKSVPRNLTDK